MKMKTVCVYCGSSPGARPEYLETATELGRLLAHEGMRLVYGGACVGVMGRVADAVLEGGGQVTGVIPQGLMERDLAHQGLTQLHVVATMHERKAMMAQLSDAFIALPGGIGTFEELFEILTWAQLGIHHKPCGLLNVAGYYDRLLAFLDHSVQEGFLASEHRGLLQVESTPLALLRRLGAA
jgi:uncharacterized protein (TIGR00730 family)